MKLQMEAIILSLVLALATVVRAAPPPLVRTAGTTGPPAKDNTSALLTPAQEGSNENVPQWQLGCTDNSTRPDCVALKAVLQELGSYRPEEPTAAINDGMVTPLTPDEVDQFCQKLPQTADLLPAELKKKVQNYAPMKKMIPCTIACVQTVPHTNPEEERVNDRCRALLIGAELIVQAERNKPEQKVETVSAGSKLKVEHVESNLKQPAAALVKQPVTDVKDKVSGAEPGKTNGTALVGEGKVGESDHKLEVPLPVPEHAAANHQGNGGEVGDGAAAAAAAAAAVAAPAAAPAAPAPAPGGQPDEQPKVVENPDLKMPTDEEDDERSDEDDITGNKAPLDGTLKDPDVADPGDETNFEEENDSQDSMLDSRNGEEPPVKASKDREPAVVMPEDEDGEREKVAAGNIIQGPVDPFYNQNDSNFFSYFLFAMFSCALCYVAYHNKSKLLGLVVEGRPRTSSGRGGFSKGRKHTAAYRKLDSNLEEAITSGSAPAGSHSSSQIIY
ncbi:trans-Golgi network integral membrane protein 2-like [Anopheles aquasalis]|uniref:trans-Golgi network integral membrane protein 2-like n=1 Tax=Anopheles aquasalis TaxID=42839 RepID=UPI00215A4B54|nr:trans-Golgi network integral membrane protein 2-like [Anopheles aquasalis]XP_050086248.1 trans-Golgi network integral membrane protein 2-like [Anopheles aquasalis]XP_050086250.1 trans-Golgi network integral membrane protein 2-like [Anopheles aquasalis]